jgi:hypothetical protein
MEAAKCEKEPFLSRGVRDVEDLIANRFYGPYEELLDIAATR